MSCVMYKFNELSGTIFIFLDTFQHGEIFMIGAHQVKGILNSKESSLGIHQ